MSVTVFNEEYKNLNKAQKQAVDTIEGPVMVVAGPGTGKTQILALRVANILIKTFYSPAIAVPDTSPSVVASATVSPERD